MGDKDKPKTSSTGWRIPQDDLLQFAQLVEPQLRTALQSIQYPSDKNPLTYERVEAKLSGDNPMLLGYINTGYNEREKESDYDEGVIMGGSYNKGKPEIYGRQEATADTVFSRPPRFLDEEYSEKMNNRMLLSPLLSSYTYGYTPEDVKMFTDNYDENTLPYDMKEHRERLAEILFHEFLHGDGTVPHDKPQKHKTKQYGEHILNPGNEGWKFTNHPTKKRDQEFFKSAIDESGMIRQLYDYDDKGKKIPDPDHYIQGREVYKTSKAGQVIDDIINQYYDYMKDERAVAPFTVPNPDEFQP